MSAWAMLAAVPGVAVALWVLWRGDFALKVVGTLTALLLTCLLGGVLAVRERVLRPLQTLSSLLEALREGDYTLRARISGQDDALSGVMRELNALASELHSQRAGALESLAMLRLVMDELDVAVFAFDSAGRLQLVNRAGLRVLGDPRVVPLQQPAGALGLGELLVGEVPRKVELELPGGAGPWELRRGAFRREGLPHQLVLLADVRRALREEERQAWQRLVQVLGHEINNSLAPIHSIASGFRTRLRLPERPADLDQDLEEGLEIIARRSEALTRFLSSSTRLARVPPPKLADIELSPWLARVVALETRQEVALTRAAGLPATLPGDQDQLEQVLINLLRNAVDASEETQGAVSLHAERHGNELWLRVLDEGHGLAQTTNLFVPFFTTKPQGSGIGLVLSRQIVEAHGGSLALRNRSDRTGAEAVLSLPLGASGKNEGLGRGGT